MFLCCFDAIPGYCTNEVWVWDFVFFQLSGGKSRILWLQRNRLLVSHFRAHTYMYVTECVTVRPPRAWVGPGVFHQCPTEIQLHKAIGSQCGYLDTAFWYFYFPLPKCTQCWGANFWGQICFKSSGLCMLLFWYEGCWNILLLQVSDDVLYLGCNEL